MTALIENIHLALPELVLLVTACLALLVDLFIPAKYKYTTLTVSSVGLVLSLLISTLYLGGFKTLLFKGAFISDDLGYLMKIFILITTLLSFLYSFHYVDERKIKVGDYYVLALFSTIGMMILVSAHSMLPMYLGLELMSLPLYALTAIRRTNSNASEAAMKYFVMGAVASGMLLYGMSLIYGVTGKLDLLDIANVLATNWQHQNAIVSFALVFIIAGIGFKVSAVPFHMWVPDVYQGAPSSVTLFISTAPKIAALGMAFRMLTIGLVDIALHWQLIIMMMAILSVVIGNVLAVTQTNIKRLLAYSAIGHMGYALLGLAVANNAGYSASLFYIVVYALMSAAAFGLVVLMSNQGMEVEQVDDLSGLNKRNPWLAFMMLIVMLSMAGVPPTIGFFTKLLVLKALVDAHMTGVAVVALIFTVVGAYYYLRIIKNMYFDSPIVDGPVAIGTGNLMIFSLNCLLLLALGFFPGYLVNLCMNAFS